MLTKLTELTVRSEDWKDFPITDKELARVVESSSAALKTIRIPCCPNLTIESVHTIGLRCRRLALLEKDGWKDVCTGYVQMYHMIHMSKKLASRTGPTRFHDWRFGSGRGTSCNAVRVRFVLWFGSRYNSVMF